MGTNTTIVVVNLPPELEAQLRDKAQQQGQEIGVVAAQLLSNALGWETEENDLPIPEWHLDIVRDRLGSPQNVRTWYEVKQERSTQYNDR